VGTEVQPGEHLIIARDKSQFEDRYHFKPQVIYTTGKLSNKGETVALEKPEGGIVTVVYPLNFQPNK